MAQLSPLTRDWSRKRELDEALGLTATAGDMFRDPRHGKNTQHELGGLPRQSLYSRLAGYEDTNDAERLKVVRYSRHVFLQMAEVAVPRKLLAAILERIGRLRETAVGLIPWG